MANSTLMERCEVNTNNEIDRFVGIRYKDGNVKISFPLGFHQSSDEQNLRRNIVLLFDVLAKNSKQLKSELSGKEITEEVDWPVHAYLYVISDYYARGYYKEQDTVYNVSRTGKTHWGRTIKTQKPYIQDDEAYYLSFVTKKRTVKDNELITLIHEYCVYESFSRIGWLFTSFVPAEPKLKFNHRLFSSVVKKKMSETFNDRNRQLFAQMLAIIDSLGDKEPVKEFTYGTDRFEYVWESMIDKVYGISDKTEYFPKTQWELSGGETKNASLRPDTIMKLGKKIYVLDAKYYKFGATNQVKHLPGTGSINKQITYGEYIAENKKFRDADGNNPTVYNAFLMPYDALDNMFGADGRLHYVGHAVSDWKDPDSDKTYEKVAGILLDVKSLMQSYSGDRSRMMELAEMIEGKVKNEVVSPKILL